MINAFLGYAGIFGYAWSSATSSHHIDGSTVLSAYDFHTNNVNVVLSNGPDYRQIGFPRRYLVELYFSAIVQTDFISVIL